MEVRAYSVRKAKETTGVTLTFPKTVAVALPKFSPDEVLIFDLEFTKTGLHLTYLRKQLKQKTIVKPFERPKWAE